MSSVVTQKTIATLLGISQPTVGAVLGRHSNRSKIGVSPELRQRILDKAEELGYRPNLFAQAMSGTRTGVIGVIHYSGIVGNTAPQEAWLCREIEKAGLRSIVVRGIRGQNKEEGAARMRHMVDQMLDMRVDGVIVAFGSPYVPTSELKRIVKTGVPVVTVSGEMHEGIPHVAIDVEAGVEALLDHLVGLGYRRIILGDNPPFDNPSRLQRFRYADLRRAAFLRQMERRGASVAQIGFIDGDGEVEIPQSFRKGHGLAGAVVATNIAAIGADEFEIGRNLLKGIAKRGIPADAILLRNDTVLQGALCAAQELGLEIPGDYGLTGHDGVIWGQFGPKAFTSIRMPYHEIAVKAMELLFEAPPSASVSEEAFFHKVPGMLIAGATTCQQT